MLATCRRGIAQVGVGTRRSHTTLAKRSYADAVAALNSLQTNHAVLDAIRASGRNINQYAIPEMIEWCRRTGFEPSSLDRLNAIHVAGTKGKGSTSAFISSILQQYALDPSPGPDGNALAPSKLGLFTSPHLRFVRERIQLDGAPLPEQDFADAFFAVWDELERANLRKPMPEGEHTRPVYFRYLTLMAFHAYLARGVDTAIVECGVGGEHDSTNVLVRPSVTGITSLGIDHTAVLGLTIEDIAWHKAGIMKTGTPAYTSPQPEAALQVLWKRAAEKGVDLKVVDLHPEIASGMAKLGLAGDFQRSNASLAVEVAAAHLRAMGHGDVDTTSLNDKFLRGLSDVRWAGRCETRVEADTGVTWYIDGAHTMESIDVAARWFAECVQEREAAARQGDGRGAIRVLLFNQQTRTDIQLLEKLNDTIVAAAAAGGQSGVFAHAFFTTNVAFGASGYRPDLINTYNSGKAGDGLDVQNTYAEAWRSTDPNSRVAVSRTIEEAISAIRGIAADAGGPEKVTVQVFVVGSVHLVGGVLEVLESNSE